MSHRARIVIAFLVIFALQGCGVFGPSFRATGDKTASTEHFAASPLDVQTRNGAVEIVADASLSEVQVNATFTCGGSTQAEADQRLADASISVARATDRTLTIRALFPGGERNGDGARLTVKLPDANGAIVNTSNGAVSVESLKGSLDLKSSNGRITVANHTGAARLETTNGAINVNQLTGNLDARTSNGRIEITKAVGAIKARSSNGAIMLVLPEQKTESFDVATSNGQVNVTVGAAFAGEVKLQTSSASVKVDDRAGRVKSKQMQKRSGTVVVGEGGATSTMKTSNGSVALIIEK